MLDTLPHFYYYESIQMSKPKATKNIDIPNEILAHILTPSELRMLKNRWQIIQLLEDGLSIRAIAKQVKVGTDTVVRVARMMERSNLRKVVDTQRKAPFKTQTPWIFGKSE